MTEVLYLFAGFHCLITICEYPLDHRLSASMKLYCREVDPTTQLAEQLDELLLRCDNSISITTRP
jgi:hypothetical protein